MFALVPSETLVAHGLEEPTALANAETLEEAVNKFKLIVDASEKLLQSNALAKEARPISI
jgi:hypothetical protein